jgi:hypothetical protein
VSKWTLGVWHLSKIGKCHPEKEDYDLIILVLIRLRDKEYNGDKDDKVYDFGVAKEHPSY